MESGTRPTYTRRETLLAVGAIGSVSIAGCLTGEHEGPSGSLDASGSNTVGPITQAAAEDFERRYPGAMINVDPQGTGAGFSRFTKADSAIQNASRDITDEERARADEYDVSYSKYTVGRDGIAIVKHGENDWLEEITLEELRDVWKFESEIETWSDIRPEYPNEEIELFGRDSASGTFDFFTKEIVGEAGDIRYGYSAHSQTNNIMRAVASEETAFGWGGFGHYQHFEDELDLVPLESDVDGEFYVPSEETIEDGTYSPLGRPLFVFVNHSVLEARPDLMGSFCQFYFDHQRDFARETGYAPTPTEQVEENHSQFASVLNELGIDQTEITYEPA